MFPWRGCRGKLTQVLGPRSQPQPRVIPDSFKRDLLNRVDIVDIIQRHLQLKKAGANYSACCPFHNEKSPSFTVSPSKQFYHCFGCGAHGDAIGFLMEYSGLGYIEAIKELAAGAGMTLPDRESTRLNSSHLGISYAVFCLKKKNLLLDTVLHRESSIVALVSFGG